MYTNNLITSNESQSCQYTPIKYHKENTRSDDTEVNNTHLNTYN